MPIKVYQRVLLLVLSLSLWSGSFALQEKPIKDNGTAQAFIALDGLTRIAVANDRLQDVRGPNGAYHIQADNRQGAVFVQPTPAQRTPFTLFLATEQRHNYVLRLVPRARKADTILLKPQDAQHPVAAHWETASPYPQAITQLLTGLVNHQPPEGYAVEDVVKAKRQRLPRITLQLITCYQGAYLQGCSYRLTNRTTQPLTFTEDEFYQVGDRAIALADAIVPPHGQTWLYKVQSHG